MYESTQAKMQTLKKSNLPISCLKIHRTYMYKAIHRSPLIMLLILSQSEVNGRDNSLLHMKKLRPLLRSS